MRVLENVKPEKVFEFFEYLSSVPHGSGNTKAISDLIVKFAKERKLEYYQDDLNNVIIYKPATKGYENAPTVMLQGHMDMVCAKDDGSTMDMAKEPIKLAVDGDFVHAVGTSLGADDCIAIAISMAVLDDETVQHPALEVVCTVDEETGMYGAAGLDLSKLKSTMLLNLDSEEEGVLTAGCAGGGRVYCKIPVERKAFDGTRFYVEIGGLLGGHSGGDIEKGRGNANKLLARALHNIARKLDLRLVSITGGKFDNVITTTANAEVIVSDAAKFKALVSEWDAIYKNEYQSSDAGVFLTAKEVSGTELPLGAPCTKTVLDTLFTVPQGIREMSMDIKGLPQTSLNLGVLYTEADAVRFEFAVRSSINSQKQMLIEEIVTILERVGGSVDVKGEYPEWQFRKDSPLRDLVAEVAKEKLGKEIVIGATHGGLETGFFSSKMKNLDIVAMGPEMYDIHSPRERVGAASVGRLYDIVVEVLKRIK